jgi:hypothetical protein
MKYNVYNKPYYKMYNKRGLVVYDKLGPANVHDELFMLIHWMRNG